MNRAYPIALGVLLFACSKKEEVRGTAASATASAVPTVEIPVVDAGSTALPPVSAAASAPSMPSQASNPTFGLSEVDFEEQATTEIDVKNAAAELSKLEQEIAAR